MLTSIATVSVMGDGIRASRDRDGWKISGSKSFVPNGHVADLLLVTARTDAGLSLFAVDGAAPGVEARALSR